MISCFDVSAFNNNYFVHWSERDITCTLSWFAT